MTVYLDTGMHFITFTMFDETLNQLHKTQVLPGVKVGSQSISKTEIVTRPCIRRAKMAVQWSLTRDCRDCDWDCRQLSIFSAALIYPLCVRHTSSWNNWQAMSHSYSHSFSVNEPLLRSVLWGREPRVSTNYKLITSTKYRPNRTKRTEAETPGPHEVWLKAGLFHVAIYLNVIPL